MEGSRSRKLDVTEAMEVASPCKPQVSKLRNHYYNLGRNAIWGEKLDDEKDLSRQEMMKAATIGRSSEFGGGWEPPGMVSDAQRH